MLLSNKARFDRLARDQSNSDTDVAALISHSTAPAFPEARSASSVNTRPAKAHPFDAPEPRAIHYLAIRKSAPNVTLSCMVQKPINGDDVPGLVLVKVARTFV